MQPASQVRTYSIRASYWPRALLTRSAAAVSANSAARAMMLAARSPAMLVHSYPSPLQPSALLEQAALASHGLAESQTSPQQKSVPLTSAPRLKPELQEQSKSSPSLAQEASAWHGPVAQESTQQSTPLP